MIKIEVEGNLANFQDCNKFYTNVTESLENTDYLTVDFKNVEYISSTAIGRFMAIDKLYRETGKQIRMININSDVARILQSVEAAEILQTFEFENI